MANNIPLVVYPVKNGAEVVKDSTDVGGGLLIAQVEIESNVVLGLRQQPE
jgi:hypothetical protein